MILGQGDGRVAGASPEGPLRKESGMTEYSSGWGRPFQPPPTASFQIQYVKEPPPKPPPGGFGVKNLGLLYDYTVSVVKNVVALFRRRLIRFAVQQGDLIKEKLAGRWRPETTMALNWIVNRLKMGTAGALANLLLKTL